MRLCSCPEIVEVEPIVWRPATVIFEPLDEAPHRLLARPFRGRCRNGLEDYVVATAAAMQAEHQYHWPSEHRRQAERPDRKARHSAEKRHHHPSLALERTVGQNPHKVAVVETILHRQHRTWPA